VILSTVVATSQRAAPGVEAWVFLLLLLGLAYGVGWLMGRRWGRRQGTLEVIAQIRAASSRAHEEALDRYRKAVRGERGFGEGAQGALSGGDPF
jgi:hypothetical protein